MSWRCAKREVGSREPSPVVRPFKKKHGPSRSVLTKDANWQPCDLHLRHCGPQPPAARAWPSRPSRRAAAPLELKEEQPDEDDAQKENQPQGDEPWRQTDAETTSETDTSGPSKLADGMPALAVLEHAGCLHDPCIIIMLCYLSSILEYVQVSA